MIIFSQMFKVKWFIQILTIDLFNLMWSSYLFKTKFKIDEKFNAKGKQNNEIILQKIIDKIITF